LTDAHAEAILELLKERLDSPSMVKINHDPYETLIITIISQNTADTNTSRAFENLLKHYKITPEELARAPLGDIEECIRVGGLYKGKAQTIHTASKTILERYGGSLNPILLLSVSEARKTLMQIPGVGPKTADVVLLFSANRPTIPVDTHVNRVSRRLGLAPQTGEYEIVRQSLQRKFDVKDYLAVHLLLISLGRKHCRARQPKCSSCPVNIYCPSKTGVP
jgi:endonuclease-3